MKHLSSAFSKTLDQVNSRNKNEAFWYKGIDLTDLLFTEIMIGELNEKNDHSSLFSKIKHFIKAKRYMMRNSFKREELETEIVFFVNSSSQWNCMLPVYLTLQKTKAKITVITTKPKLLNLSDSKVKPLLIRGFQYSTSDLLYFSTSKDEFSNTIKFYLPQIKFLERKITNFFLKRKPKYILVGNDITFEGRLFATIAKRHDISTGMIQHGAIDKVNLVLSRSIVDQIFVYGIKAQASLKFLGVNPNKVVIAGWPQKRHNDLSTESTEYAGFVVAAFSGYGHSVSKKHHLLIIDTVKKAQQELRFKLCIKIHPKDDKKNYEGFINDLTVIVDNTDLKISFHELLKQASMVISGSSTSVLDALLVGTPVITIDLLNEYSEVGFIKDGLTKHATSYESLKNNIIELLSANKNNTSVFSEDQKNAIEGYYYRFYDNTYLPEEFITKEILLKSSLQNATIEA